MAPACKERYYLSELLDNELPEKRAGELRAHMKTCDECQKAFSDLAMLDTLMKNLPEIDPSPDFNRSFEARLATPDRGLHRKYLFRIFMDFFGSGFRPQLVGVAIVIMIVWAVFLERPFPEPTLEDRLIAENLEFFSTLDMIDQIDLFTNWDAISEVDENT